MFEWMGNALASSGSSGAMSGAASQGGGGLLGWLMSSPQGMGSAASSSPQFSRLGMIGAGLKDIGGTFNGQSTDNLGNLYNQAQGANDRSVFNQKIRDAYATGDMNNVRSALVEYAMAGGDISHITGAMNYGQPKVMDIGGTAISVGQDGKITPVFKAQEKAPPGYQWGPNGKLQYIPGGPADPEFAGKLSDARRKPSDAAPTIKKPWEM